jgi:hypothetical protein
MDLHNKKMELVLPVFMGGLSSLVLCAALDISGCFFGISLARPAVSGESDSAAIEYSVVEDAPHEEEVSLLLTEKSGRSRNLIQEMYRKTEAREWVIDFFEGLSGSRDIAGVILANADAFDIEPALAFALSWEESRFKPTAISRQNRDGSIDRGLFQLNNRSFPRLETDDFFDPAINARYGMGHLRFCLDSGGSEIAALAIYNAGAGKIQNTGAPKTTLNYVNRILENRRKIEERFALRLHREAEARIAEHSGGEMPIVLGPEMAIDFLLEGFSAKIAEAEPARPRLMRLAPLRLQRVN